MKLNKNQINFLFDAIALLSDYSSCDREEIPEDAYEELYEELSKLLEKFNNSGDLKLNLSDQKLPGLGDK